MTQLYSPMGYEVFLQIRFSYCTVMPPINVRAGRLFWMLLQWLHNSEQTLHNLTKAVFMSRLKLSTHSCLWQWNSDSCSEIFSDRPCSNSYFSSYYCTVRTSHKCSVWASAFQSTFHSPQHLWLPLASALLSLCFMSVLLESLRLWRIKGLLFFSLLPFQGWLNVL